jgi:F-type H+-transporting ATPase subunit b
MGSVQIDIFPVLARLITVWISTGILFFFFKKFFWNSLMDFLQKREEFIISQVEAAKVSTSKAQEYEAQANESLKQARLESKDMIDRSKDEANSIKDEIIAKANQDAKDKVERANIEINKEKEKALDGVHNQIVDIAMEAAKKIVKGHLDEEKSKDIVDDFIKELPN